MSSSQSLRDEAVQWLRSQWSDAVIVPELSVASWGGARLDLAAVMESQLIGVEIKGDGDSPSRLSLQGMLYSSVCSRIFLLTSKALRQRCLNAKPPGWLMARNSRGQWWNAAHPRGDAQGGYGHDGKHLPTSAIRLVDLLWSEEIKIAIDIHGVYLPQNAGRDACVRALAEELPLKVIRPTVYWLLYRRRWEHGRMPKSVWRPDALAT